MASPNTKLRWALLFMFILVTCVNFGVFLLPGGQDQFTNTPNTRIDAAAYAFPVIWSVIFFGMIAFSIYLLRSPHEQSKSLDRAIVCLLVAGVASILFVPISLYASFVVSWFDIVAHLIALLLAVYYLRKHVAGSDEDQPSGGRWLFFAPSMYLGWISAATAISSALALRELQISVEAEVARVVTMMVIACLTVVGALVIERRDIVFGVALAWAFAAIGFEQTAFPSIQKTAWAAAGLLMLLIVISWACRQHFYAVLPPKTEDGTDSNEGTSN